MFEIYEKWSQNLSTVTMALVDNLIGTFAFQSSTDSDIIINTSVFTTMANNNLKYNDNFSDIFFQCLLLTKRIKALFEDNLEIE